jgi:hypothetical protein
MDISNIFINIENKHFSDTDFYALIISGSYSKQILRNEIQRQFDDYCDIYLKMKSPYDLDYPFISYVGYVDDTTNPLTHCLINHYIYPKNGTGFLNYYHTSEIIKYLMAIGFKTDFNNIKKIVEKITSEKLEKLDEYSNYIQFYKNCEN